MRFEIYDPAFQDILLPESAVTCLGSPATWAEGPVWLPQSDSVVFSDVKANRMFRWTRNGEFTIFRHASNYSNGNYLDRTGQLVSCEHGRRCISLTDSAGAVQILVDRFDGKRLNSPNDLVVKSDGSIWFTDPPYGILGDAEGYKSESQVIGCYVYRYDPATQELSAQILDIQRPNGLAFSPDESVLYVADMSIVDFPTQGRRHLVAYDIAAGRKPANRRVIAEVSPGIPDGFRVDQSGRIFCSCEDGILVLAADGQRLGKIPVPERVSNCTFGGPGEDELFITASTSLYHIHLVTQGCQYSHLI